MTPHAATGSHQQTIRRELVHRCAISEVFVTSLRAGADNDHFIVGAQLPRMHGYYGDHTGTQAGHHDPLLVMEAARQAAIAVSHEFCEVPLDSAFLVREFNGIGSGQVGWLVGAEPANLDVAMHIARRHVVGGVTCGMDAVLDIACAGETLMVVDGSFSWTSPHQWRAIREQARGGAQVSGPAPSGPRAQPDSVGRGNPRNVVIGDLVDDGAGPRAEIIVDPTHPALFDHVLDHVPGSLLLEACRQVAIAAFGSSDRRVDSVRSTFQRFVELDRPAHCVVREGSPDAVTVMVEQDEVPRAEISVGFVRTGESPASELAQAMWA